MKEVRNALLSVLQQRMDKCTSEQFWAVGAITGLDAFLISQKAQLTVVFQSWAVMLIIILLAIYAISFIISRHIGYFYLYDRLVDLIKNEPETPTMFKDYPSRWKSHSLSGVIFYCAWVALATASTIAAYW